MKVKKDKLKLNFTGTVGDLLWGSYLWECTGSSGSQVCPGIEVLAPAQPALRVLGGDGCLRCQGRAGAGAAPHLLPLLAVLSDQTLPCLWQRRETSADLELSAKEKEERAKVEIRHLQTQFHHEAYKRKFYDANVWREMQAQE